MFFPFHLSVEGTMHRLPRPQGSSANQDRRQFRPGWVIACNLKRKEHTARKGLAHPSNVENHK
jgi:hypothetical protein